MNEIHHHRCHHHNHKNVIFIYFIFILNNIYLGVCSSAGLNGALMKRKKQHKKQ